MTEADAQAELVRIKSLGRKLQVRIRKNCTGLSTGDTLVEVKDPRPKSGTTVSTTSKNTADFPNGVEVAASLPFYSLRRRNETRGGTNAAGVTAGRFTGHTGWLTYTNASDAETNIPSSETAFT